MIGILDLVPVFLENLSQKVDVVVIYDEVVGRQHAVDVVLEVVDRDLIEILLGIKSPELLVDGPVDALGQDVDVEIQQVDPIELVHDLDFIEVLDIRDLDIFLIRHTLVSKFRLI